MKLKRVNPETEVEEFKRLFPKGYDITSVNGKIIRCKVDSRDKQDWLKSKGLVEDNDQ